MSIDKADFEAWLDLPATQEFMRAVEFLAEDAEDAWMRHSWQGGQADDKFLHECRGRAANANFIADMDFDEFDGLLKKADGVEEDEEPDADER